MNSGEVVAAVCCLCEAAGLSSIDEGRAESSDYTHRWCMDWAGIGSTANTKCYVPKPAITTITSDDADKQGETDNLYERRAIRDDDRNAV